NHSNNSICVMLSAGGGGGGFETAGGTGMVTMMPPGVPATDRGAPAPGGVMFDLLPLPANLQSSLDHFLVGGSGGGGAGSHPFFSSGGSAGVNWLSGRGGTGGGGAIAFRAG